MLRWLSAACWLHVYQWVCVDFKHDYLVQRGIGFLRSMRRWHVVHWFSRATGSVHLFGWVRLHVDDVLLVRQQ